MMQILSPLLGIEDVSLDADKRVTSLSAANGRVSINLGLFTGAGATVSEQWLDLTNNEARVFTERGAEVGLFVCAAPIVRKPGATEDIVCAVTRPQGASLLLFERDPGGGWRKRVLVEKLEGLGFVRSISTGDINGDGRDEVLLASRPHGRVVAIFITEAGVAEHVLEQDTYGHGTTNAREVLVFDVDGSGSNSVLVTTARTDAEKWASTPGEVILFRGSGTDWSRETLEAFGGTTHSRMIRVGQLGHSRAAPSIIINEVGIYDSASKQITDPTRMLRIEPAATGWATHEIAVIEDAVKSRGFDLADVDGDGRNELVVGTRAVELSDPSYLYLYREAKDGQWTRETIERSGALGYHHVEGIDLDGDGRDEIVASDDSKGMLKCYKLLDDGSWEVTPLLSIDHALFCVSIHALAPFQATPNDLPTRAPATEAIA